GTFVQTSGAGSVIAVGDSIPYVIGTDSNIYHYSESEPPSFPSRSWPQVYVGATRSLAASPEGAPWRVDTSGFVYKGSWSNNSWTWTQEGSSTFWEIAVGKNDSAWGIGQTGACTSQTSNSDCPLYQLIGSGWQLFSGATARHVAVAPDGTPWISNAAGDIYKLVNGAFTAWAPGTCVNNPSTGTYRDQLGVPVIGAGPRDEVWSIGCTTQAGWCGNAIQAWNPINLIWEAVPGAANTVSVAADGTPWVINCNRSIYQYQSTWQFM